ncbi:hypothetical protein CRG98_008574 [Punica granatum]|uniref:Uncharacterized protein n=1 Tax=Punica granatum TaxID=22663 RepID=A0A2I0KRT3_PUNGR|nr:hypothetical protein CRG98_008574 [Punica granatum]
MPLDVWSKIYITAQRTMAIIIMHNVNMVRLSYTGMQLVMEDFQNLVARTILASDLPQLLGLSDTSQIAFALAALVVWMKHVGGQRRGTCQACGKVRTLKEFWMKNLMVTMLRFGRFAHEVSKRVLCQSVEQICSRADRISIVTDRLYLYSRTDIEDLLEKIQSLLSPPAVIVVTIQNSVSTRSDGKCRRPLTHGFAAIFHPLKVKGTMKNPKNKSSPLSLIYLSPKLPRDILIVSRKFND